MPLTGASMDRHQHVERDEVRDNSIGPLVKCINNCFMLIRFIIIIITTRLPSLLRVGLHDEKLHKTVGTWSHTFRVVYSPIDASERIQPRVVDTWVDPTSVQPGRVCDKSRGMLSYRPVQCSSLHCTTFTYYYHYWCCCSWQ